MDLPTLAVTGSTGNLGGRVAAEVSRRGFTQRLLARTPSKAPLIDGATAVACSYANDAAARAALTGVDTLFMVSGPESEDRVALHHAFIDAAASAGVRHIVYTSFVGAAEDATFTLARDHGATEAHIMASGMDYTFLRDNFYIDFLPQLANEQGVIRGPAGTGATAAVSRADIARVAACVLTDPQTHARQTYELTGPESLTLAQVALVLGEHRREPIGYYNESLDEAYAYRRKWNAPQWQLDAWVSTYTAIAEGVLERVTDTVERITGRVPENFSEYLVRTAR